MIRLWLHRIGRRGMVTLAIALAITLASLGGTTPLSAQADPAGSGPTPGELKQRLATYLEKAHAGGDFPGASAAVVLPSGRVISATLGYSSVDNETPLTTEHLLFSGSIGKTYFAALALRLATQDRLDLDKRVADYLGDEPWYVRIPNHDSITVRHLMQHQSGIPRYILAGEFWETVVHEPDHQWTNGDQLRYVYDGDAVHPAGAGFAYSDTNFILLGLILERITGETAYDSIRRELLMPNQLEHTVPTEQRTIAGLAQGYTSLFRSYGIEGEVIRDGKLLFNPAFEWGGGGYASRTSDLARWTHLYFSGAAFDGDYLKLMLETPADAQRLLGPGARYGLGVILRDSPLGPVRGHDGVFPGFLSASGYFPDIDTAAAIQFNTDNGRSIGRPPHRMLADMISAVTDEAE